MPAPNMFINYVRDAAEAARFYSDLFEVEPVFTSPRYIAFEIAPGATFAVWSGAELPEGEPVARSEMGLTVPGGEAEVDALYARWVDKGITVIHEPHTAVFGRTFVVADPDGNLIRVAPVD